jgi:hypothetical protein
MSTPEQEAYLIERRASNAPGWQKLAEQAIAENLAYSQRVQELQLQVSELIQDRDRLKSEAMERRETDRRLRRLMTSAQLQSSLLRDQAGAPDSLKGCGSITPHGPIIVVQ